MLRRHCTSAAFLSRVPDAWPWHISLCCDGPDPALHARPCRPDPLVGRLQGATTAGTMTTTQNAASATTLHPPPHPRRRPRPKVPCYAARLMTCARPGVLQAVCVLRCPSCLRSVRWCGWRWHELVVANIPGSRMSPALDACSRCSCCLSGSASIASLAWRAAVVHA